MNAAVAASHGHVTGFEGWRQRARALLAARVAPDRVAWSDAREPSLLGDELSLAHGSVAHHAVPPAPPAAASERVPRDLLELLRTVAMYRDPQRWDLMYRLLWRVVTENHALLEDAADPLVRRAQELAKAVRRDLHKMHAFVRFREVKGTDDTPRFVAWFEPEHLSLEAGARFFVKRFGSMHWMIVTPDGAAVWDQQSLQIIDAPARDTLPRGDSLDPLWRTYYRSICNVARIKPHAMQREMPQKYWKNLPEAAEIVSLLREAPRNVVRFDDPAARAHHAPIRADAPAPAVVSHAPAAASLDACRRCELWRHATQPVPGEGPRDARIVLVGEQPGDEEDLRGRPFVGPAGQVLDGALQAAGVDRHRVYLTNAVKHFKWEPRGKRRIHKTAGQREIAACQHWLLQELDELKPTVVVALGATALRALAGPGHAIERARHEELQGAEGSRLIATYHPSAVLRADDGERLRAALVEDLRRAAALLEEPPPPGRSLFSAEPAPRADSPHTAARTG